MPFFRSVFLLLFLSSLACGENISNEQLTEAMRAARANPTNGYHCSGDFCFVRADLFGRELLKLKADPENLKKALLRYPAGSPWKYHIATVHEGRVADPLLDKPLRIDEWANHFAHGKPCVAGDPMCTKAPEFHTYAVVDRNIFTFVEREAAPDQPPTPAMLRARSAHLTYIRSESGEDFSDDPRRVDSGSPARAKSNAGKYVLLGFAGTAVGAFVFAIVSKKISKRGCPADLAQLTPPPPQPPLPADPQPEKQGDDEPRP